MPTFNGDPSRVSASLEVFPKDDYELAIGEPKAFRKQGENGENYGIRTKLTVMNEGPFKGKAYIHTMYYHSEGALPMNKRFIMAAFGYPSGRIEEARFNTDMQDKDWNMDFDTGAVGDAFREMTGKRIVGSFDTKIGRDGNEQQDVKAWRPV